MIIQIDNNNTLGPDHGEKMRLKVGQRAATDPM